MNTKEKLNEAMKAAMKSGDELRKRTIRMTLAAVKQAEVDKRVELEESALIALLQKEVKIRREALEEAKKAERADLAADNEAEIKILEEFLPQAMSADELRALIQSAIQETNASAPSDMGKVMKVVIPQVAGRAPNDAISAMARTLLNP